MKRYLNVGVMFTLLASVCTCMAGDRDGTARQDGMAISGDGSALSSKAVAGEDPVSVAVDIGFSGNAGRTVTDQYGINYNVWGMSFYEDKVYPPMYWGVFPMYFFGDNVGVSVAVENNSVSARAKLLLTAECYCLRTDGSNGAPLMTPAEYETTLDAGESSVIDASFGVEETPDAESGLDRFLVKVYLKNEAVGQGEHTVSGEVNINPNNNEDCDFALVLPNGVVLSRDTITDGGPPVPGGIAQNGFLGYTGPAAYLWVKPKGNGNENALSVDGAPYEMMNGTAYVIEGDPMDVNLYPEGNGSGQWYLGVEASNAVFGPDEDGNYLCDDTEATELLLTKEAIFCPPELERALLEATIGLVP